ncbi:tryptophan--tRNA ligase [Acidipila sp. EB88]|nr:tryptophan--tRNA ligase [Acidipila sp. EB88]
MRPTGKLHLGNYMGALHNWVRLQHAYACFFFVADVHALTTDYADPSKVPSYTHEVALDWLSAGLDPERCTIFVQSHVKQHYELHTLLSMMTPLSWLERVPTYKDQIENLQEKDLAMYGFLGYPLLQSADILLYGVPGGSLHVPVGADQVAHVELTREVARRFNHMYAPKADGKARGGTEQNAENLQRELLNEPQVLLTPTPKLPGTDGRKMSKSYGNFILLSDPEAEIRKKLKPMVTDPARVRRTDPGNPDRCPVGDLHKVFSTAQTLADVYAGCTTAGIGCIECKGWLADAVVRELAPMQERRAKYEAQPGLVREILAAGSHRAGLVAEATMQQVRAAMGLA